MYTRTFSYPGTESDIADTRCDRWEGSVQGGSCHFFRFDIIHHRLLFCSGLLTRWITIRRDLSWSRKTNEDRGGADLPDFGPVIQSDRAGIV